MLFMQVCLLFKAGRIYYSGKVMIEEMFRHEKSRISDAMKLRVIRFECSPPL